MNPHQWTPQDDTAARAEHRDVDRVVFASPPTAWTWSPACRCYTAPMPLECLPTRYPKRWSRAKRKEARAREMRAVDRTIARVLAIARKFRRSP